jgi:ADP-ribosyl-[dinitrogen reductase] hydrolase
MDGLAMALHGMYHTTDANAALVRVINFCGDADTTGAICGQLVGAFYGIDAFDPVWRARLATWDAREIELRAVALAVAGEHPRSASGETVEAAAAAVAAAGV